jgi:KDO2-lipid IV(A) lauroyltransferase
VIYALADVAWVLVYLVVGYRRKVVRKNLSLSFPEKTEDERRQIERRFYRWLCDYFLETVKLLSMSREDMLRHIEFRGAEEMEKCFDEGQACAAILGHYCNWEYLSATALAWKRHTEAVAGLIYHPLYNKIFDRLFIDMRSQMGGTCIPKKDILRYLLTYKREGRMSLFGYIADQSPKWENIHLWLNSLTELIYVEFS